MNLKGLGMAFASIMLVAGISAHDHQLCQGIIPENDLSIPVQGWVLQNANGVTERAFNEILDKVERVYKPIFTAKGERLKIERKWSSDVVNAYASRSWGTSIVAMFGGLARHPEVTQDAFMLVACHEVGHHIGGAPKNGGRWSSNEGQSDYFGTLKCMRHVLQYENNEAIVSKMSVPSVVRQNCQRSFNDRNDQAICIRTAMAGQSMGNFFSSVRNMKNPPNFKTPDYNRVSETFDGHPAPQCRLDTYYAGSICNVDYRKDVDQYDPLTGVCSRRLSYATGVRPLCWYKAN